MPTTSEWGRNLGNNMITQFNVATEAAGMLLPSALCCIVSGFTPSSHLLIISPVMNKGGIVPKESMHLQVVEELASIFDTINCKATTCSSPNEDDDDSQDFIVNGMPKQIQQNPL